MWIRLGQADDPAWRRKGQGTATAAAPAATLDPATIGTIDEEIRLLLDEADLRLGDRVPDGERDLFHEVLAAVLQHRLGRLKEAGTDTDAFVDQLRRRLSSMSRDLAASESEVARLREAMAVSPVGALPSVAPSSPGDLATRQDFKKRLSLLTKIVEENLRLREEA
jgi:hypothetical protein